MRVKKTLSILMCLLLAVALLAGCGGGGASSAAPAEESAPAAEAAESTEGEAEAEDAAAGDATEFEMWLTEQLHVEFFDAMQALWNEANPDRAVKINYTVLPYEEMHSKLLVATQSGTGAPDMADIELGKFANFLKGEPQLYPLTKQVEAEKDNIVQSRLDIYSKDGEYYGLDFHIGASVMYYNTEILEEAGVDYTTIKTWNDYHEAGKKVLEATGLPMTSVDTGDMFGFIPSVVSQGGQLLKEDGSNNINSPEMIQALGFFQEMLNDGTAVVSPGGSHSVEEYWGFMNGGGSASVSMPLWFMGRFTDHMTDLAGKVAIAPNPVWEEGQPRSVGLGGTGSAVTLQCENPELAADFLAFAKLSKEGNIRLWTILGFDPIRKDVWDLPELKEPNKFTDYFINSPFDVLIEVEDEIPALNVGENFPDVYNAMTSTILYRAFESLEDPATIVEEEAQQLP